MKKLLALLLLVLMLVTPALADGTRVIGDYAFGFRPSEQAMY